jgi:hypothetical protein
MQQEFTGKQGHSYSAAIAGGCPKCDKMGNTLNTKKNSSFAKQNFKLLYKININLY